MLKQPHTPAYAFQKAMPCLARTRRGTRCLAPAANGKGRCRLHGGARGSSAPFGNSNAFKHGFYSKDVKAVKDLKNAFQERIRLKFS